MSHTIKRGKLHKLIGLYERNYGMLMSIIPGLRHIDAVLQSDPDAGVRLHVSVIEHCKYTTLVSIRHFLHGGGSFVPNLDMKVRISHDAKVVEVVSYQQHGRIQPSYKYPNSKMYLPDEKYQHNHLLCEWLHSCISQGYSFVETSRAIDV